MIRRLARRAYAYMYRCNERAHDPVMICEDGRHFLMCWRCKTQWSL